MQKVYGLIRRLGISKKYKGYQYLADAVILVMEMEEGPVKVTKDIYPVLARRYHVTPEAIEQNIRTVVGQCWGRNRSMIEHADRHEYREQKQPWMHLLCRPAFVPGILYSETESDQKLPDEEQGFPGRKDAPEAKEERSETAMGDVFL